MSKYIRTENGIIYVGDLIKDESGNYCDPKNYETDMEVPNEYIIKESNTIEELCDEFRYKFCEGDEHVGCYHYHYDGKWYDKDEDIVGALSEKEILTIRGAIWTDKGLIYVAKMNEKGELELI